MERFYGQPFTREYRSLADIMRSFESYKDQPHSQELAVIEIEQWTVSGATACPKEKTQRQMMKYFPSIHFLSLEDMLTMAEAKGHV
ncbi:hypothetical protein N7456_013518 [Penicillium angulare]|uniref:Uncharacterized protein n=1 Tax=Penicillium angulare TaxID=116970 RepID=A0A9W9EFD8_9EURO|nr:hypothetical protein N7456_013518 [Penicillium angulare]